MVLTTALPPLLLGAFISFGLTPLVIWLYRKKKWVDDPAIKKHPKIIHEKPVPRGGGIPIFLSVAVAALLFLPLDKHLIGILLGGVLLAVTGVLDDIYDIHPKIRLVIGFIAASCVVLAGIGIPYVSNPIAPGLIYLNQPQIPLFILGKVRTIWVLADIFAFFWIVGMMNFVNWSKGLDGQLPGFTTVAAIIIALLSDRFSADITQWQTGLLALIIAGAFLGFLPWNFYPQKIMPGYGGGALAGYLLAVLAILSTTKVNTLIITLGIPLIDAFYVVVRRIFAKQSPLWGDTRHLHHALLALGWGKRRIALFYWLTTALLGIVALRLNSQQKFYTIISLILVFGIALLWIRRFITSSSQHALGNG